MKKLFGILAVCAMCFATIMPVNAAPLTGAGSDTFNATVNYTKTGDVFKIDITFGSLVYDLTERWNVTNHDYDYIWEPVTENDTDKITITNHSNVGITATFAWEENATITGVIGTFDDGANAITGAGLALGDALSGTESTDDAFLTLSGEPSDVSNSLDGATVGTVTVTIAKTVRP